VQSGTKPDIKFVIPEEECNCHSYVPSQSTSSFTFNHKKYKLTGTEVGTLSCGESILIQQNHTCMYKISYKIFIHVKYPKL